ncbi:MAG: cation-transporting P-type ATPase [Spirochaetes bacterium]|nr:cation-transporting P-type ATPase [Spirochaetota bacterium]
MDEIQKKVKELETNTDVGLLTGMAGIRLEKYGKNILYEVSPPAFSTALVRSLLTVENFFLLLIAGYFIYLEQYIWILYPAIFLCFSTGLLYSQIIKLHGILSRHLKEVKLDSRVIRDKREKIIKTDEIVPGDIIIVKKGDIIPADVMLLEANDLFLNNEKTSHKKAGDEVYKFTLISAGWARAVVLRTGKDCKNKNIKSISLYQNNPYFQRARLYQYIFDLLLVLLSLFLYFQTREILISLVLFMSGVTVSLLFFTQTLLSSFFNLSLEGGMIINNYLPLLRKATPDSFPPLFIIDRLDNILKDEFIVRKIYCDGRLFEVTGDFDSQEGLFCQRDKSILKDDNWEQIDQNLYENHNNHRLNRKVPDPFDAFKRINVSKHKGLNLSLLIGKYTSSGILEKSLSGKASSHEHPLDFAFLILHEKAGIKESWHVIKQDKLGSLDIAFVRKDNKYYIFARGPAEIVIQRSLFLWERGKEQNMTVEREEKQKDLINRMSTRSLRVMATAYQRLSEKTFQKMVTLSDPSVYIKALVLTSLMGIKVELADLSALKGSSRIMVVSEENYHLVDYLLRKAGICREDQKVITAQSFSGLSQIDYLHIKDQLAGYAEFDQEQKASLINFFAKKNSLTFLISDETGEYTNGIRILNSRWAKSQDRLSSDILIENDLLKKSFQMVRIFQNFYLKLKQVVTEKFINNLARIVSFGSFLFLIKPYTNPKLYSPFIFSFYLELLTAFFHKKVSARPVKGSYHQISFYIFFFFKLILILTFMWIGLGYIKPAHIFTLLFVLLILDFFFTTDNFFMASLKVFLIMGATYFLPFMESVIDLKVITPPLMLALGIFLLLTTLKKRLLA